MRYFEIYETANTNTLKKKIKDLMNSTSSLLIFKKIANRVTDFLSNEKEKPESITEDIGSIKSKLFKMIERIDDPVELDTIYSLLQKDVLLEQSRMLFLKKFGSTGRAQDRWFINLILNTKTTFEEKEKFLSYLLQHDGLFNGSLLLSKRTGSFDSLITVKNNVYEQIKTEVLKHSGQLGFGPDQGPMEIFLVLFGSGISLASKGDLDIAGNIVEIKASQRSKSGIVGGRPVATSGYSTPAGVKNSFYTKLKQLGATDEFLDENSVNLNPKGFSNINQILIDNNVKPEKTKELIDVIFKGLYPKMDDSMIKRMYRSIESNGTINTQKFLRELAVVQIMYYKGIEGFEYILIANSDSTNYVLINTEKDAEELYDSEAYKLSSLISWNESRGGSATTQVIVY